jgi:hypothetical protein
MYGDNAAAVVLQLISGDRPAGVLRNVWRGCDEINNGSAAPAGLYRLGQMP